MPSAISFGVFCRRAPSTIAIMRSRKVLPGSLVMRMTMRSLMTRVPPVTALRSPPLSRMTGADSPVMADSSTLAMPSITSPSRGNHVAGFADDEVALLAGRCAGTFSSRPSQQAPRHRASCASCAALRPGLCRGLRRSASAKLAKSTVNQSQSVIWRLKPLKWRGGEHRRSQDGADQDDEHHRILRHCTRGSSFRERVAEGAGRQSARDRRGKEISAS